MGGKDVIYLKQLQTSDLEPRQVRDILKQLADKKLSEEVNEIPILPPEKSSKQKEERMVAWDVPQVVMNSLRPSIISLSKKDVSS